MIVQKAARNEHARGDPRRKRFRPAEDRESLATLEALGVRFEPRVLSAHRTPQRMAARARELEGLMYKVIIAAAGGSAICRA